MNNHRLTVVTSFSSDDYLPIFKQSLQSLTNFGNELIVYALSVDKSFLQPHLPPKAKIISLPKPIIIEEIRNQQIRNTSSDWVLLLDYDEIVSPSLRKEILTHISLSNDIAAYALLRHNYSLGYRISHGGWDDDYQLRLINKKYFLNWPKTIHSFPRFSQNHQIAKLSFPLYHYKDPNLEFVVAKTNRYSQKEAQIFYQGGLRANLWVLFKKPLAEFLRRYLFKLGFLDGPIGLIQSLYQAFSVFVTYAKLYEKQIHSR